jgi:predicted CxxxxCH...CXXCH cytochrome family protein
MGLSSASRANFSIGSGAFPNVELITPRVDPVERAVVFTARTPLEKNTQYSLTIHSGGGANALVAYDGAEFQGTTLLTFTTADDDDTSVADSDVSVAPCEAYDILSANCSGTYCHGGGQVTERPSGNTDPAMGLNLHFPAADPSNPAGFLDPIQLTAVGHMANEVADPSNVGGTASVQPRNFPVGMPIISPNASSASYLMYKILMSPPSFGSDPSAAYIDPSVPDLPNAGQATADDLSTRMFGQPMPDPQRIPDPTSGSTNHALTWTERAKIRAWIDSGAPACGCKKYTDTYACVPPPGGDAGPDGGDAGDAGSDTGTDAGSDTATDAPSDTAADGASDGASDGTSDAGADASDGG